MNKRATIGTKEAAKMLNVKQSTVAQLCRNKKLKGATQDEKGSPWQIPLESVEERAKLRDKSS